MLDSQGLTRWLMYSIAAIIIIGSLLYSNYLARQLALKEQESVELFARAFETLIADPSRDEALFFVNQVREMSGAGNPKILLTEEDEIASYLLELPEGMDEGQKEAYLRRKVEQFRAEYEPFQVEFLPGRFQEVVYGESTLLRQIRWFPIAQLALAFTFIGIVMAGFVIAKRNEQNRVWVGLAKETAHQLGTPVSSLMAWIELLRINLETEPESLELVEEMARDVSRLEDITERFSKIGSHPELIEVSLSDILDKSADYLKKRMTRRGNVKVEVNNHIPLDSQLQVNPQLFDWVIENLLKNALDAIQSREGSIILDAGEKGDHYYIDVSDTGKGIAKNHFKKVFAPGFTTKKRGWGLGLSLTKRIVENYHKGKIFVKQSEVGKGTTFRILLPRE